MALICLSASNRIRYNAYYEEGESAFREVYFRKKAIKNN